MIAIPLQRDSKSYDVILVLEKENIDRMMAYDPMQFRIGELPEPYSKLRCGQIRMLYATGEEMRHLMENSHDFQSMIACLKHLERGWKFRPEMGDGEQPFSDIRNT